MSTKYTIKVPDGAARWGTAMSENITKCIHELAAEIKETMKVTRGGFRMVGALRQTTWWGPLCRSA